MATNETKRILALLKLLSESIDNKCDEISELPTNSPSIGPKILKLCDKVKKNCEAFESQLDERIPINKNYVVTLNLVDILGREKCNELSDETLVKFKKDVELFTKNYLKESSDPVFQSMYQLFCSDSKNNSQDSLAQDNANNLNADLKAILASDSDASSSCGSSQLLEKNNGRNIEKTVVQECEQTNTLNENTGNISIQQDNEKEISSTELQNSANPGSLNETNENSDHNVAEKSSSSGGTGTCAEKPELVDKNIEKSVEENIEESNKENIQESNIENIQELLEENVQTRDSSKDDTNVEKDKISDVISSENEKISEETTKKTDFTDETRIGEKNITDTPKNIVAEENDDQTLETTDENSKEDTECSGIKSSEALELNNLANQLSTNNKEKSLEICKEIPSEVGTLKDSELDAETEKERSERHSDNSEELSTCGTSQNDSTPEKENGENLSPTNNNEKSPPICLDNSLLSQTSPETDEEDASRFLFELGLSKKPNYEKIRQVRDELLVCLNDVVCREDTNGVMREIDETQGSDSESDYAEKYTEKDAEEALKELDDDSFSFDDSLSGSEMNLSLADIDELLTDSRKNENITSKKETITSHPDFVPKKCSVVLVRNDLAKLKREHESSNLMDGNTDSCSESRSKMEESSSKNDGSNDESRRKPVDEDAEIDRLCELSTLDKKRRKYSVEKTTKRKIKRKRRSLDMSGSETSDLSDYSSVSETEIKIERILEEDQDDGYNFPVDPDTLLVDIVCQTIHDSDSESSVSLSCDEEQKENKKRKHEERKKEKVKDEEVKTEEKEPSWKDDPLLRGNLNVPSERDATKEKKPSRKRSASFDSGSEVERRKKARANVLSRFVIPNSSDSSSDSSSDDFEEVTKKKRGRKSDEDSDIEFIGSTSSDIIVGEDKKTQRKNIKSVLSSKDLMESTQKAAEEEKARVAKLEEQRLLVQSSQGSACSEEEGVLLDVSKEGSKITIDPNLSRKMFPHQISGVKFMWEACYLSMDSLDTFKGSGCILAHNMGLGKTFQVVTLVHTLFSYPVTKTKHVLIVCPLSTVSGWKKEFINALKIVQDKKDIKIITIESHQTAYKKMSLVRVWKQLGGVLILGYDAFCRLTKGGSNVSESVRQALVNPGPDLVVCDEGHLLKNGKALRTRALMDIKTKRRIALTGTPIQNNLNEYYYMVQFVKPNLLGSRNEFGRQFINPIMNGQYEDSHQRDITLMKKRTHVLHRILKNTVQRFEATELHRYLENMRDYALFIQLHPIQEKLYRKYLELTRRDMKDKQDVKSFFRHFQILKYIGSHPQLLQTMETQNNKKGKIQEKEVISEEPEINQVEGIPPDWWKSECPEEVKTSIEFGTKLKVMVAIIEEAEKKEEKVLIFTSSLVELSSVEYFLKLSGTSSCTSWKSKRDYFRMDGTVPPSVRTTMCDMFNDRSNKTLRVFLMSHKVGGLGLNLTAANRIILLGANFNPCHDSQSIYRAYRFGQEKPVYIYRLLPMGTMEEKIYHRCITKLAVASRVVDKHQIARHYKNLDLDDLYKVDINLDVQRATLTKPDDDVLSSVLLKCESIHKYHHHQQLLENLPDEDLNEEDQRKAWEEFEEMQKREKTAAVQNNPAATVSNMIQQKMVSMNFPHLLIIKPNSGLTPTAISNLPRIPLKSYTKKTNALYNTLGQPKPFFMPEKTGRSNINNPFIPGGTKQIPVKIGAPGSSNQAQKFNPAPSTSKPSDRPKDGASGKSTTTPNPVIPTAGPSNLQSSAKGVVKRAQNRATNGSNLMKKMAKRFKTLMLNNQPADGAGKKSSTEGANGRISSQPLDLTLSTNDETVSKKSDVMKTHSKSTSAYGPNPLYLKNMMNKTPTLGTTAKSKVTSKMTAWRTSSSDDFQKVPAAKVIRRTTNERPVEEVIDITEDTNNESNAAVARQLNDLRGRNMTITRAEPTADNSPVIDIT